MADIFRVFVAKATNTVSIELVNLGTTSTAIIRSLSICNTHTSSTASVDVTLLRSPTTTEYFLHRFTQVTASQTVEPITSPVVLDAGDVLKIRANSGNVDAVATILETY